MTVLTVHMQDTQAWIAQSSCWSATIGGQECRSRLTRTSKAGPFANGIRPALSMLLVKTEFIAYL